MKKLLSHAEAKIAGDAMFDRWRAQTFRRPPFSREDAAWADLARAGWDAVHRHREQEGGTNG